MGSKAVIGRGTETKSEQKSPFPQLISNYRKPITTNPEIQLIIPEILQWIQTGTEVRRQPR